MMMMMMWIKNLPKLPQKRKRPKKKSFLGYQISRKSRVLKGASFFFKKFPLFVSCAFFPIFEETEAEDRQRLWYREK